MKNLLAALLLLPTTLYAQDADVKDNVIPKNEIGLSMGNYFNIADPNASEVLGLSGSVSYLRNIKHLQLSGTLEVGGTASNAFIIPSAAANYLFLMKKGYLYTGFTGGYYNQNSNLDGLSFGAGTGYMIGVQAGCNLTINKHLSFNSSLAVRTIQYWQDANYYIPDGYSSLGYFPATYRTLRTQRFYLNIPLTVGIRYRF